MWDFSILELRCIWLGFCNFIKCQLYICIRVCMYEYEGWLKCSLADQDTLMEWDHHHHHIMPPERISLTLSRHFSLSFIASGRSSGLHPVSSHSCCMYVRAGRPAFARPYELVPASPAVSCMSGLSNLDSFHDGRQVAI